MEHPHHVTSRACRSMLCNDLAVLVICAALTRLATSRWQQQFRHVLLMPMSMLVETKQYWLKVHRSTD